MLIIQGGGPSSQETEAPPLNPLTPPMQHPAWPPARLLQPVLPQVPQLFKQHVLVSATPGRGRRGRRGGRRRRKRRKTRRRNTRNNVSAAEMEKAAYTVVAPCLINHYK